jgi:hypothetical protein
MSTRNLLVCLLYLGISCVAPTHAVAQCGGGFLGIEDSLAAPNVSAVFSGTVINVQTSGTVLIVTFDVDRIWKGRLSKRVVLYRPAPVSIWLQDGEPDNRVRRGSPVRMHFELRKRYVVVAHDLSPEERIQFKAERAAPDALATELCGGGSRPFDVAAEDLERVGPGRAPQ